MLRVALTGGIATGKSYVLDRFRARLVPTLDADVLAREAVAPERPAWVAVREQFGPDVCLPNGSLDRKHLAAQVFDNPTARAKLEAIVHPYVRQAIADWFNRLSSNGKILFAVADIPLLFETGRAAEFDRVIAVACDSDAQLRRVMARDGLSKDGARKRLAAQLPIAGKVKCANFVIRTDGNFAQTEQQVEEAYKSLLAGV